VVVKVGGDGGVTDFQNDTAGDPEPSALGIELAIES
jgi:hypothetical protein